MTLMKAPLPCQISRKKGKWRIQAAQSRSKNIKNLSLRAKKEISQINNNNNNLNLFARCVLKKAITIMWFLFSMVAFFLRSQPLSHKRFTLE